MQNIIGLLAVLLALSCQSEAKKNKTLKTGTYRAIIEVQDNKQLPFIFEVESSKSLKIVNAEEIIEVDEIEYRNDSVFITTPVFEGYIAATFNEDNLTGSFIKESLGRIVPFSAEFNNNKRFETQSQPNQHVTGIWETVFSKGVEGDEYIASG